MLLLLLGHCLLYGFLVNTQSVKKIYFLSETFYFYRLHDESITHTQPSTLRLFYERVARESQKQRKATGKDRISDGDYPSLPDEFSNDSKTVSEHVVGHLISDSW